MNKLWLALATGLIAAGIFGCAQRPQLSPPGTAAEQQRRAQRMDPYPQTDMGPAMAGVRPREYDKPFTGPQRDYFDKINPRWGEDGRPQQPGM